MHSYTLHFCQANLSPVSHTPYPSPYPPSPHLHPSLTHTPYPSPLPPLTCTPSLTYTPIPLLLPSPPLTCTPYPIPLAFPSFPSPAPAPSPITHTPPHTFPPLTCTHQHLHPLPHSLLLHPLFLTVSQKGTELTGVEVGVEGEQQVLIELEGCRVLNSNLPYTFKELRKYWGGIAAVTSKMTTPRRKRWRGA